MPRKKLIPLRQVSVVHILESARPFEELREYLDRWRGIASIHAAQVALGAAHLMLGDGGDPAAVIALILDYWDALPDPGGFHANEFLKAALAATDDDTLYERLFEHIPDDPSVELLHAIAVASEARLARALSAHVAAHVPAVRAALDEAIAAVRELDGIVALEPPASLDQILAAERACAISLPDDYRALLTLHDGMRLWDEAFLGTRDYARNTDLSTRAADYLDELTRDGSEHLVPIAHNEPRGWLLHDPRGAYRRGPGYVLRTDASTVPLAGVADFLAGLAEGAREMVSRLN